MRRLIVNADDFGMTPGINRGIAELAAVGAISSATLMAAGTAAAEAMSFAKDLPMLGIGCHIVLLDGYPVLPPQQVPTLLGKGGQSLRSSLASFVRDILLKRIKEEEIEAEAVAQIEALQAQGLRITHLDTHKHTHMFPRVLRPVIRAAVRCGVPAIRNSFEPEWSRSATQGASTVRGAEVAALKAFYGRSFRREVAKAGLKTSDGTLGVLATGIQEKHLLHVLNQILDSMPQGTWELVCHPGHVDPELRATSTRLLESREKEFAALMKLFSSDGRQRIGAVPGQPIELVNFSAI